MILCNFVINLHHRLKFQICVFHSLKLEQLTDAKKRRIECHQFFLINMPYYITNIHFACYAFIIDLSQHIPLIMFAYIIYFRVQRLVETSLILLLFIVIYIYKCSSLLFETTHYEQTPECLEIKDDLLDAVVKNFYIN